MLENQLSIVCRWAGESESWVTEFLFRATTIPSIKTIVIMGSAVRNVGHRRSDLDLLVLFCGKKPSLKPPLEVDIRMYAADAADKQIESGQEILCWAMKFGTPLYDPSQFWESLRYKHGGRIPLPSIEEALERAQYAMTRAREMLAAGDDSAADDLILAAVTQVVRVQLLKNGIFPASRPELPKQLEAISPHNPLSRILEDSMYSEISPAMLFERLDRVYKFDVASTT